MKLLTAAALSLIIGIAIGYKVAEPLLNECRMTIKISTPVPPPHFIAIYPDEPWPPLGNADGYYLPNPEKTNENSTH